MRYVVRRLLQAIPLILVISAAVFALLATGTIAAVSYWGLPEWVPVSRPTFALGQPDLQLDFPADLPRNLALTERWAARAVAS